MANAAKRLDHNVPGDFYVDSSCIDCDTCRWMAPDTFLRRAGQASVHAQPQRHEHRLRAEMALLSCPTGSIGTEDRHDLASARAALPDEILSGVHHCGYHHEQSFGAASYLIVREEGNILVDSPRFTRGLVKRLEELGGVATMFLTHIDDVADHERFARHFGCERILHARDARRPELRRLERLIEGDDRVELAPDVVLIPVPGHTEGSTCLLWAESCLFTGDHIAMSASLGHLYAFRSACWFDWDELIASTEKLKTERFEWILPGHGRRTRIDAEAMPQALDAAIRWMKRV